MKVIIKKFMSQDTMVELNIDDPSIPLGTERIKVGRN